jgi:hypothetical protein
MDKKMRGVTQLILAILAIVFAIFPMGLPTYLPVFLLALAFIINGAHHLTTAK